MHGPTCICWANLTPRYRATWQQGDAKALGIRTYPCIGYGDNITGLRALFQPENQQRFVAQLVAAVEQSDVDGVNLSMGSEIIFLRAARLYITWVIPNEKERPVARE